MISNLLMCWMILNFAQDEFKIESKRVGSLEVGSYAEDIYYVFDKEKETRLVDRYFEASFSPAIEVSKNGELLFMANLDCDKIYSFEVFSPRYKTDKGITIASNFGQLKKAYKISSIENQEGALYAFVESLNISFSLETMKVLEAGINVNEIEVDNIPNDIGITSIIVL